MRVDFEDIYNIVKILRKKCPWDKTQTISSMVKEMLEEVYEVSDAINKKNYDKIKEEVGDIVLSLFLMIKILEEKGLKKEKILKDLKEKIIRKHPHVFKGKKFKNKEEFLKFWEEEKKKKKGIYLKMPSFLFFEKVIKRLKRLGKIDSKEIEKEFKNIIGEKEIEEKFLSCLLFYSSLILILKNKSPEKILRKKIIKWQSKF